MAATPTKPAPPEDDEPEPRHRRAAKFTLGLYQQIAAVFAAFGLAALVGDFWDVGWKGFLETIVGVWSHTVRPAVEWVFHVIVTTPRSWFAVRFEVPLWARDYLAIGAVLVLSGHRTRGTRIGGWEMVGSPSPFLDFAERASLSLPSKRIWWSLWTCRIDLGRPR